ncbi:hypothetical protein BDN67DRAFT_971504 [Paxillus ammoniavirescens]|nr:hypothetical protein BDN67DRAFT_971504 [Paxillus ammoniavirescens]
MLRVFDLDILAAPNSQPSRCTQDTAQSAHMDTYLFQRICLSHIHGMFPTRYNSVGLTANPTMEPHPATLFSFAVPAVTITSYCMQVSYAGTAGQNIMLTSYDLCLDPPDVVPTPRPLQVSDFIAAKTLLTFLAHELMSYDMQFILTQVMRGRTQYLRPQSLRRHVFL